MKKALILASVPSMIEQFNMNNIKILQDLGYEVEVAANFEDGGTLSNERLQEFKKELEQKKIRYIHIPFSRKPFSKKNIQAYKLTKKILTENEYDLIHLHSPIGGVCGRIAAKNCKKTKVIYTAHGFHFYKGAPIKNWIIYYPIEKYLSKYTDVLITINKEDYERAKAKFKAKNIQLVHGIGVDKSKFDFEMSQEEKNNLRQSLNLKEDDFVMICVGELNKNKNQIMAIESVKNLIAQNKKNIKLLLVGEGVLREFYQQKIKEYHLENNVYLLGYRKDVPKLLKISNVLISLSYREGLPVNVMEGLIAGLPVIVTNCRGNRDLVQDGVNGYIIDRNNKQQLEDKILKIISEKQIERVNMEQFLSEYINDVMKEIYTNIEQYKVLHLLASNSYSGAENVACQIIKMFKNEEFEMKYCSPVGEIQKRLEDEKISYIPLEKMNYQNVKKVIKEYKPDIIHAHDIRASIIASKFYKRIKIVSHIHGNHDNMKALSPKSILYYLSTKRFAKIFWVSQSAMQEYYFANKVAKKSEVLINVIDKEQLYSKLAKDDNEYTYDIIYLGRLSDEKNPLRVYEIMKEVIKRNNKIKAVLVGDGIFKEILEKKINQDEMQNNIILKGNMENPMKILKSAKVMIMASKYEGTPMCSLEAMALGIPIVSTPTDGLTKVVQNGYNGFLSSENEELVLRLEEIIYNEECRIELSNNAIKRFNEINEAEKYKEILEKEYRKR